MTAGNVWRAAGNIGVEEAEDVDEGDKKDRDVQMGE